METTKTILVVDDESSIRISFSGILKAAGYHALTAENDAEAIACVEQNQVDVVFLDINLDKSSGLDLLSKLKNLLPMAPIIMITGNPHVSTAADAIRRGAFDYIPKPIEAEQFLHSTQLAIKHLNALTQRENYKNNLNVIFQNIPAGVILVDHNQIVVENNQQILDYFRTEPIAGKGLPEITTSLGSPLQNIHAKLTQEETEAIEDRCECVVGAKKRIFIIKAVPCQVPDTSHKGVLYIIRDETRIEHLEQNLQMRAQYEHIVGQSPPMQAIYDLLDRLMEVDSTVLITGPSGTGKELVADALHYRSIRREGPFIKVNCAALPENLLESELFGHMKGSFTGAMNDKVGRFQLAHNGTIFLDEIGDVSPALQVRLLRVLQEKEIERVGGYDTIPIDVRIVAATNQNLKEKVKAGEFREDLYYRLRVISVSMPSLRERREDIPLLVDHFVDYYNAKFRRTIKGVSPKTLELMTKYHWPGNVRELQHAIEHAFVVCRDETITPSCLPPELFVDENENSEALRIVVALKKSDGNKSMAARMLGMSRRHIYRKIEEYDLDITED